MGAYATPGDLAAYLAGSDLNVSTDPVETAGLLTDASADVDRVIGALNRAGFDGGSGVLSASQDLIVLAGSVEPGFELGGW